MSINRAMDKEVLHVHGILLSHKMDEMPFAATWIQLEIIILSEASPKKDKYYMISLICGI